MSYLPLVVGVALGAFFSWLFTKHYYLESARDLRAAIGDLRENMRALLEGSTRQLAGARLEAELDHADRLDKAAREGEFVMALETGTLMDSISSRIVTPQHHGQLESAAFEWNRIRPLLDILRAEDLIESTESWLREVERAYQELPTGKLEQDQVTRLKRLVNEGKGLQNRFTRLTAPRP